MTFVLKDLAKLKTYFDNTILVFLESYNVKTLSEIPSPRRDQLLFLKHVLEQLHLRSNDSTNNLHLEECYYAAMLVVLHDVRSNISIIRGETEAGSKLLQRLEECLGISEQNKPELKQYAAWHRNLNELLNSALYNAKDSRQGLNLEHAFTDMKQSIFTHLVKLSYNLEEEAAKKVFLSLTVTGKSKATPITFRPLITNCATTQAIVAKFGSFDALLTNINQMISAHLGKSDVGVTKNLSTERATQIDFLETLAASLQTIEFPDTKNGKIAREAGPKDFDKAAILAGAMHIVRSQIAYSYTKDPISISAQHSRLYTKLNALLNVHAESPENIQVLVAAAHDYIKHLVTEENSKVASPQSLREEHQFSSIAGFQLPQIEGIIQAIYKSCRVKALEDAFSAAYPKEQKSVASYIPSLSSITSFWSTSNKKPTAKPTEEDEDIDHEDTPEEEKAAPSSSMSAQ